MSDTGHGGRPMTLRDIADDEERTSNVTPIVCVTCGGTRWICEEHRGPWGVVSSHPDACSKDCAGPGEPCPACNTLANAGLRSELTPIVNDAFKRASSAQQAALPDPSPFVEAILGVIARYRAQEPDGYVQIVKGEQDGRFYKTDPRDVHVSPRCDYHVVYFGKEALK